MLSEATRFRVKRATGELELGVGGSEPFSGWTGFDEPCRLDSVEMLTGDRGVSNFDGSPSTVFGMVVRRSTWFEDWKQLSVRGWAAENI